jgi:starch-binding outer membrane protein, SusD/RagB family
MKKILFILSTVLVLTGCNNFLDTEDLTDKTTANFPETEKEADQVLTGIYAHLLFEDPETSSSLYIAQLAGDDCIGGNLSYSNNCATNFLMYTSNLNGHLGLWDRDYTLINRANNGLVLLDNFKKWSSDEEKNRHYGEIYFLRAIAYYELAQVFGGVPLRTTPDATNIGRSTVDEVYAQIASDLKSAIDLLPAKIYTYGSDMAGHTNKYAAEAYMARVFLFYTGRYAKTELPGETPISKADVIKWIDDCVNNSGHSLVSDQRNLWGYTNSATEDNTANYRYQYVVDNNLKWVGNSSVETVFANKHNLKSNWTYTWWTNTFAQFCSPSADNYSKAESYPFGTGWGAGPVSPAMVDEWKAWSAKQTYTDGYKEDPRLTGSIWSYKAMDPNNAGTVLFDRRLANDEPAYTVSYRYFEQTGYFQKKYININSYYNKSFTPFGKQLYPDISNQTSQSLLNIADLIHMRFADVLLMQSELEGNATGLNKVRARSHLAPVAYSLEAIKEERRWELAFEGLRWWDLLRWSGPSLEEAGTALNKQNNFTVINAAVIVPMVKFDYAARLKQTQGYWPIPQDEIDLSNGLIEQNPGWDASAQFSDWSKL